MRNALLIMGATATGKSRLALELAAATGRAIISADSRQVYQGLRIGSAQPSADERARVSHHFVDFLPLTERWSAQEFATGALEVLRREHEHTALVVGGTGFYLECLTEGLFALDLPEPLRAELKAELETLDTASLAARLAEEDPATAARLHPKDRQRILRALEVTLITGLPLSAHHAKERQKPADMKWIRVLLQVPRDLLHARIEARLDAMLAGGWVEEVEALLASGADPASPGMRTLGYPELVAYVRGEHEREAARERILVRTRQFAKRQESWFRHRCPADLVLDPDAAGARTAVEELLAG